MLLKYCSYYTSLIIICQWDELKNIMTQFAPDNLMPELNGYFSSEKTLIIYRFHPS